MALERGLCHLFVSRSPDGAYKALQSLMASGARGLCITRNNPRVVKERHNLGCPVIWLARAEDTGDDFQAINPEHILKIHTTVVEFLRPDGPAAIILDGLEYLVTQNDFNSVIKLLALLNERIAIERAWMLIPVNPDALDTKELGILERECHRVE